VSQPSCPTSNGDGRRPERVSIRQAAQGRLQKSDYPAVREVQCDLKHGVLRVRGILPTRYLKQVALALVADVEGVDLIINEIEVGGRNPRSRERADETDAPSPTP
jgi:hypothetical protein